MQLTILDQGTHPLQKPDWLKLKMQPTWAFNSIKQTIKELELHTVCEEAHCPNQNECWSSGTATFMVLGDTCTRACKFCNIKTGFPGKPVDQTEPKRLAQAVKQWNLDYVVITSVDRDDLADQGSTHFANCIAEIKKQRPETIIEVLIPDFRGSMACLDRIINAKPDVIAHNIEVVKELQKTARDPRANYTQSLAVLEYPKLVNPEIVTKTSIMLGLGETRSEVIELMQDLLDHKVDILTIGQYARPSPKHLPVIEYVHPDTFKFYEKQALEMGFKYCASGPFVRGSYKARDVFDSLLNKNHLMTTI
ncbi:MAG: lipoyl synthase [DPANN group archaeon]|nr:lipoyl synthase [DPANN group archaeon]